MEKKPNNTSPEQSPVPEKENGEIWTFPDLLYKEFLAMGIILVVLVIWGILFDAPLLEMANPARSENPAKAAWYFVGLQELLVYFDPWIAGVALPILIILGLAVIPYLDTTRYGMGYYGFSGRGRMIITINFIFGFLLWWILIIIGEYLRGPNWQIYWPWEDWSVTKPMEETLWSPSPWIGVCLIGGYFILGLTVPALRYRWLIRSMGTVRYLIAIVLLLLMYAIPIKIILRIFFHIRYVLITPWFNI
ncbi:MAG: hypothetical protein JSU92_06355 [Deltaproteobacteria bacterium]|nr:MAG: hypothetical protein JSU92_06355 [Deltaproteobacteria bacterium]